MFVLTLSKRRALRVALVILAVFIGAAVGIAAILTSINTGAAGRILPIYSVDRPDNKIALTFDCAWGNSNTDELLEILARESVFATFFVTGEFVDKYPEDVRRFAAAGHEIANHSDMHPHVAGMNIHSLIEDTREAERKITMITGQKPTLYRSPYGEYDDNAIKTVEGLGYRFVQWSVDSIDWQEPDPATIVKRVTEKTVSGSILLFHNDLENTTEALPEVITRLRQAGFEFARVSDLIYHENYHIDHTGKQIRDVRAIIPTYGNKDDGQEQGQNTVLSSAIAVILERLTPEEIRTLSDGISPQIIAKVTPHLTIEQLNALMALTEDDAEALMAAILEDNAPLEPPLEAEPDDENPEDPEDPAPDDMPNLTGLLEQDTEQVDEIK